MKTDTIPDTKGNYLIARNYGDIITLSLKLSGEMRERNVGVVILATKTFFILRERAKHLFKRNCSYGINYQILERAEKFDKVQLSDEQNTWLIPLSWLLDKANGSFLFFKQQGFELQKFYTLKEINQFKK